MALLAEGRTHEAGLAALPCRLVWREGSEARVLSYFTMRELCSRGWTSAKSHQCGQSWSSSTSVFLQEHLFNRRVILPHRNVSRAYQPNISSDWRMTNTPSNVSSAIHPSSTQGYSCVSFTPDHGASLKQGSSFVFPRKCSITKKAYFSLCAGVGNEGFSYDIWKIFLNVLLLQREKVCYVFTWGTHSKIVILALIRSERENPTLTEGDDSFSAGSGNWRQRLSNNFFFYSIMKTSRPCVFHYARKPCSDFGSH